MNYEHDNGFGQTPGMNRRPPSRGEGTQYGQRGNYQRMASSGENGMTGYGPGGSRADGRRISDGGSMRASSAGRETDMTGMPRGTGRPAGGRMSGSGTAMRETAAGREAGAQAGRARRSAASGTRARRPGDIPPPGETVRGAVSQAKIKKAQQKRRTRRLITMIVAECLTLMLIFTYGYFARRLTLIQHQDFSAKDVGNSEISVDTIKKMKGYRMIAVFGVDSRDNNVGAGCQSDVNIICCINEDTGEIKLVSVYRDTYLNINDEGSYRKFNAAYTNGGPKQALKALNKNLDLDITEYITFSWKAVADGINILGGVDIDITKSEFRFINGFITETVKATGIGSHQLSSAGPNHLDGVQAVAYGRLRLMDTDYARTERQRKIIELAFAKAKQADYAALNNILVTVLPSVSTNLTFADMTSMALNISKYHIGETAGFPFAKGNVNIPGKGDCVIPQTLESNVSQLHTFLFGDEAYEPTEQVKQISSKVASDSGMYKEGKPSKGSAIPKDSDDNQVSTRPASTEAETRETERETDAEGNIVIPWETDENGRVTGVYPGMTDADGNLIDAPIEDWPEEGENPGGAGNGQNYGPGGITNPGTTTSPNQPGGNRNPAGPGDISGNGENRNPNGTTDPRNPDNGSQTLNPGQNTGPGGGINPGGVTGPQGGTNPGGTTNPDGNTGTNPGGTTSPGGTTPGGNTGADNQGTVTPGGNGGTSPGGTSTTPTQSWEAGPGVTGQNNNQAGSPGDLAGGNNGGENSPQGPG